MGAARKYPDELRDRAIRLVLNVVRDQDASVTAACRKVGGELGIKPDTLRPGPPSSVRRHVATMVRLPRRRVRRRRTDDRRTWQ